MKLHPRLTSIIVWILAVALTCSPLIAQNPQLPEAKPKPDEVKEASPETEESTPTEPVSPAAAEETWPAAVPAVATPTVPTSEEGFQPVAKRSTTLTNPSKPTSGRNGSNPGESKWIILAALLATGAAVAAILLFRGFGGDDDDEPVGTIISAGPPAVNVPN
jgi:hypothetical protein